MNCYRQTVSDDICDRSINCLVFSVQLDSTKGSSQCSSIIWIADYTLDQEYYNFGDRPKPHHRNPKREDHQQQITVSNIQLQTQSYDRPHPTPHKRQAESNLIEHMGVVNLPSGHPALSGHTQVRLVRTQWGDMELITLESDLAMFTDYYSRLQLLNMKDNELGVVGVSAGQADNDSHKYLDILETQEAVSKQPLHNKNRLTVLHTLEVP
ncbi:hypothetical protein PoB_003443500 [Plakobranchus ocellatus]|uniref:Uncharacterized protein n=1 Tax=Plakobranchus ocellatus TaxID=259542 RepID=A0AAV4AID0_9GAST|nr:hypothetical protein PoB_003443500 [Plakobranchus ocellatus]